MSSHEHKICAGREGPIPVAIVTVSDTRTPETDVNRAYLEERITAAGHELAAYSLIKDEPRQVAAVLDELCDGAARVILFNGGTPVTIKGMGFRPGLLRVQVSFGGIPAKDEDIRVIDTETLEVVTPAGRIGAADLTVTLDNGQTRTLAVVMSGRVAALRRWAADRAVPSH